jgi:hypothetical protein
MQYPEVTDPLCFLLEIFPYDPAGIRQVIAGEVYVLAELENGNMGVSSTLGHAFLLDYRAVHTLDPGNIQHRILALAWLNASVNTGAIPGFNGDIFDFPDAVEGKNIVMVGDFRPLVAKFQNRAIPLKVFDLIHTGEYISPIEEMEEALAGADTAIVTSTAMINASVSRVLERVRRDSSVFMLGPSTPLHDSWFRYPQVKGVFGMQFEPGDSRVKEAICLGMGTPAFSGFAHKVALLRHD